MEKILLFNLFLFRTNPAINYERSLSQSDCTFFKCYFITFFFEGDEDDVPLIQGFSDDDPLVEA